MVQCCVHVIYTFTLINPKPNWGTMVYSFEIVIFKNSVFRKENVLTAEFYVYLGRILLLLCFESL